MKIAAKVVAIRVVAATAMLLGTCLAHAEAVDRRTDANPRGEVEVVNVAGSVRVTGWDRAEVQVHAELGRGVERLDVLRDGDHTLIKVVLSSGRNSSGSDLEINVPRDSSLTTNTVSATQAIQDVRGTQRLQSVSGDIDAQVWEGEFQAKTVSGEVLVSGSGEKNKGAAAQVRVTTVSGDLKVTGLGLSNELDLRTVSGDIDVSAQQVARAHINTTNGSMEFTAALTRDANIEAETINGELNFKFDGTVNAEFDISTFNGDIDNCFGPKPKRTHEFGPGTQLRFKEGDGTARVRAKTLNGEISICRK